MNLVKFILVFFFFMAALALFIAATATAFVQSDPTGRLFYGYWNYCTRPNTDVSYTCNKVDSGLVQCSDFYQTIQAAEAFFILSDILIGVVWILSMIRFAYVDFLARGPARWTYMALAIFALLCSIVAWCLAFALYGKDICGKGSLRGTPGVMVGQSPPLAFVGSFLFFVGLIIECTMVDVVEEPAPKTQPEHASGAQAHY
jgi:hypothetical protein